jgi:hypothetical protein
LVTHRALHTECSKHNKHSMNSSSNLSSRPVNLHCTALHLHCADRVLQPLPLTLFMPCRAGWSLSSRALRLMCVSTSTARHSAQHVTACGRAAPTLITHEISTLARGAAAFACEPPTHPIVAPSKACLLLQDRMRSQADSCLTFTAPQPHHFESMMIT